jgi:hypothetical protein
VLEHGGALHLGFGVVRPPDRKGVGRHDYRRHDALKLPVAPEELLHGRADESVDGLGHGERGNPALQFEPPAHNLGGLEN